MIREPKEVNTAKIEERLIQKATQALKGLQGRRQPHVTDIFTKRLYISPDHLQVVDYLRRRPLAAFNPGALLQKTDELFLRHENHLLWLGGISDYAIGIFIADSEAALQELSRVA